MSRMLLVDGDILVYRLSHQHQVVSRWDHDTWTYYGDLQGARRGVGMWLAELQDRLDADSVRLFLSDSRANWRHAVYQKYKGNRAAWAEGQRGRDPLTIDKPGPQRPVLHKPLREVMRDEYGAEWAPSLEADDLLGIRSTEPHGGERILVSADKDMQTIPGLLFNPDRPDLGVLRLQKEDADRYHLLQTLVGDSTDNYSGAKGIGPVKAERLLPPASEWDGASAWAAVVAAYAKAGHDTEYLLSQARIARVLRFGDYDFNTSEVRLWTPEELQ